MNGITITELAGGYRLLGLDWQDQLLPGQGLEVAGSLWPVLRADRARAECLGRAPAPAPGAAVRGPVGEPFDLTRPSPRALLLGDDSGLAPLIFLAGRLRLHQPRVKPLLLLEARAPLPFRPVPSRIMVPGVSGGAIAALPLLEDWGVPSRLAGELPGGHDGPLEQLARDWLEVCQGTADVTVYGCGGEGLLARAGELARRWRLDCQIRAAFG
ncbi:MAG: hypothetical protein R3310_01050 [Candidatus Competibacteraceae bacterium]|nr:hypothetical protein [Candidatus Competibacteraceae bacterium]